MSALRFEVVHTGPYAFHARLVARNDQIVWVTESYRARSTAHRAIDFLRRVNAKLVEVREVDER